MKGAVELKQEHFGVNSILEGPILRQLLTLFWPILLGTFFQQLYNTADAIIVGQYVDVYKRQL